jgi:hypothetical protein
VSKYAPLWQALKDLSKKPATESAKGVSIKAHPLHHARIFKALKKRKTIDIGWKLSIYPKKDVLYHTSVGNVMNIKLVRYPRSMAEKLGFLPETNE